MRQCFAMYSHIITNVFEFIGDLMLRHDPMNMNSKRSINLLIEALLALMNQKPYKKITISEITTQAGVVRSTFYAHFTTKEDVLSYHIFEIFKLKYESTRRKENLNDSAFIEHYFDIWGEQVDLLKQLNENDLLMILNQLDSHFEFICESYFSSDDTCLSKEAMKYANAFYADTLASILKDGLRLEW